MILMIDNYDSFTYNLVRYCKDLGVEITVRQNDCITLSEIKSMAPAALLLSPGPCSPNKAGICLDVVKQFTGDIPILGICLGHQVICQALGGDVVRAPQIVHGKTSALYHSDTELFFGLPQGFAVTRYHSLVAKKETLPEALKVTAWTQDDSQCLAEIMAVKHRDFEVYGVQYHPEALLTEYGYHVLAAFFTAQSIPIQSNALQLSEVNHESTG